MYIPHVSNIPCPPKDFVHGIRPAPNPPHLTVTSQRTIVRTKSIDAPVYSWNSSAWTGSAWTGTRCQMQRCVLKHSARLASVLKNICRIRTLKFRLKKPQIFGKGSLNSARSCCIEMDGRAIAAERRCQRGISLSYE